MLDQNTTTVLTTLITVLGTLGGVILGVILSNRYAARQAKTKRNYNKTCSPKWYSSIKTSSAFPVIDENRSIRVESVLQNNSVKTVMVESLACLKLYASALRFFT